MKKSIFLKIITIALALVLFAGLLTSCLEPDCEHYDEHYYERHHITKKEVMKILEISAKEYADINLQENVKLSSSTLSVSPFFSVNQNVFTKLFVEKDISENNAILTSKEIFKKAVMSAYTIVTEYKDFKVNNIYDAALIDQFENKLDTEICPVGIIDDKNGGIYLLYFDDSIVENITIQAIFHISLEKGKSIIESSVIYAGSENDEKGLVTVDHIQSVANETIEFASARFIFDDVDTARRVSKVIMSESSVLKELKEHLILIEYEYAVYENNNWTSNGLTVDISENKLTEDTLKLYKVLSNEISEYNADFSVIFNDDIKEISIVIPIESETSVESATNSEIVESTPADGKKEEIITTENSSESN